MLHDIPHLAETYTVCAFHEPPRFAWLYLGSAMPKTGNRTTFLRYKRIILLTEAKQVVVASCPSVLW